MRQEGSPPHVWGILLHPCPVCQLVRFTPTRVGNTRGLAMVLEWITVHPHTCGEYAGALSFIFSFVGSPPHVWGILQVDRH